MRFAAAAAVALLLAALTPAWSAQADDNDVVHVVAAGQNLFRIALHYGVPQEAILRANGLTDPHRIFAGQRLRIPGPRAPAQAAVTVPAPPPSPQPNPASHLVAPGQNLFRISLAYGVTVADLLQANGLSDARQLRAGQVLVIPLAQQPHPLPVVPTSPPPSLEASKPTLQEKKDTPATASPAPERPDPLPQAPNAQGRQAPASGERVFHRVEPGQNLYRIALAYGVPQEELARSNGLSNPHYILAGQVLLIPVSSVTVRAQGSAPRDAGAGAPPPSLAHPAYRHSGQVFRITFYCLVGPMSSGRWVYAGAAAADASIFPLGTVVGVEGWGTQYVEDRFAWDAAERRLDIWLSSCTEALHWGVQWRQVTVLRVP